MGLNPNGRVAFLTNFRDLNNIREDVISRGALVSNFLEGELSARRLSWRRFSNIKIPTMGIILWLATLMATVITPMRKTRSKNLMRVFLG